MDENPGGEINFNEGKDSKFRGFQERSIEKMYILRSLKSEIIWRDRKEFWFVKIM